MPIRITIPETELLDESTDIFIEQPELEIELEHSLVSLSKWESKYKKSFLSSKEKTTEEILDYIAMMSNVEIEISSVRCIKEDDLGKIQEYIESRQSATTFSDRSNRPPSREIITAEIVYYWMISYQIPFECQYWHLDRLLTLLRVLEVKNQPAKKMSKGELARKQRSLNAQRRAAMGSSG